MCCGNQYTMAATLLLFVHTVLFSGRKNSDGIEARWSLQALQPGDATTSVTSTITAARTGLMK